MTKTKHSALPSEDYPSSFVFNARGDLKDFAIVISVLESKYNYRIRSKSDVIATALAILAQSFKDNKLLPFPINSYEEAEAYLKSLDFLNIRKNIRTKVSKEVKLNLPSGNYVSSLEKARREIKLSSRSDSEHEEEA